MPEQALAPVPGGGVPVRPARIIPPLPPGFPILPEELKAPRTAKPLPLGRIVLLVVVALVAVRAVSIWYSDSESDNLTKRRDDDDRIVLQAVTPALMAHAARWTRIPVALAGGQRLLQIEFTVVHHVRGKPPATCVWLGVLDAKTGARVDQKMPCIPGLDYLIQQQ